MIQVASVRSSSHNHSASRSSRRSSAVNAAVAASADDGPLLNGQDLTAELDRLRKEKIATIYEIEKYKKRISFAIFLAILGFSVAVGMIIWKFSPADPSWEELRNRFEKRPLSKRYIVFPLVLLVDWF